MSSFATSCSNTSYVDTLEYEYNNHQYGYLFAQKITKSDLKPEVKKFWEAYLKLQENNHIIYMENAKFFNMKTEVSFWNNSRACISVIFSDYFPSLSINFITHQTKKYIKKLEKMLAQSPPEHDSFFKYILEQEKLQLAIFMYASKGQYDIAASEINDFLSSK